jgi:hypothetical protein
MLKQLTATTLTLAAVAMSACSVDGPRSEDVEALQQEIVSCSVTGLEWKPFVAHLAYDAAEDFGRWEFTTDLYVNGDRLAISQEGYNRCASRGRTGCPAMTAGLSAQEGWNEVHSGGKVIINPNTIRTTLVNGWLAQQNNENNLNAITDPSESSAYQTFRSASRTGLPHSLTLTNCAATIYADPNYSGASQCLRTGNYRMADLRIGNDAVSSIKVRSGMKASLYQHDQYQGTSTVVTSDQGWLGGMNDQTSSLVVAADNTSCSAVDTYKISLSSSGDWTKIRGKLVTLGYMRGNDVLDVRLDIPNNTIDVDPYNVDFVPPSQIGGTTYGVAVKSSVAETWRSTEDPSPSIFPVGATCKKKPYGSSYWYSGTVRSSGSYRFCYCN